MRKDKKKPKTFGKGDWGAFLRVIPNLNLPWGWIIVVFFLQVTFQEIQYHLPGSTAALFSGDFSAAALNSALFYQGSYAILIMALIWLEGVMYFRASRNARTVLWGRMLNVRMEFYDQNNPSNLLSAITNDTEQALTITVRQITSLLPSIYYVIRVLWTLNQYDYRLLLSILVVLPLNVIYTIIIGRWYYEANAGIYKKIGGLTAYLGERVQNMHLIREYTNENKEAEDGIHAAKELFSARMKAAYVTCASDGIGVLLTLLQRGVPVIFGVLLLRDGYITTKQWVAFFLYSTTLISTVNTWVTNWRELKTAQGSAARLIKIMQAPTENRKKDSGETVKTGSIEFRNVSFSYGESRVLHNISFTVPEGKTTAIVGLCGSGKTTVLSLMERLYVPEEGEIFLNGENVADIPLDGYRKKFAYVQQDSGIFSGTVRDAMTYGIEREISDEELIRAATFTGAYDFVKKMTNGFDTEIAISGTSVSGGQRQRIVLTREVLKNKDIMILDEPTSALDAITAREIKDKIFELFCDKTLVMVTHDLGLISAADQIIVLFDGRIYASGTHTELMNTCDLYSELVNARAYEEVYGR